ncbi:MAG TPA: VOC family protein [Candidatus Dormibacteraeota bacterium]
MDSVRACLTFPERCEDAVNFYVSLIPNSRVLSMVRWADDAPAPVRGGGVMHCSFELDGIPYTAFDGGETFRFSEAFSLVATCASQEEIDRLWDALAGEGGGPGPCGWVKDRFGVSWQVVPRQLGEMLGNAEGGDSEACMKAMLGMGKLDIAELERAYRG